MHKYSNTTPLIGEVYLIKFEGCGNVQNGWRPGLIIQNNIGNECSPNVIAVPLTSALKNIHQPTHVVVNANDSGLKKDSMILCENPETISKELVGRKLTTLSDELMAKVARAIMLSIPIISFLNQEDMTRVWTEASAFSA